jgi:hypothetical protein
LMGGFQFFYLQFSPYILKWLLLFFSYFRFRWFLRSHVHNGELCLFRCYLYYFITICYIIIMLWCRNNNIWKVK